MSQSGFTPIQHYYSTTAGHVPTTGNLQAGELAINIADGILFYNNGTSVAKIASNGTAATTGSSILKGNGSGGFSNATSGTDYAPPTSGTSLLYGNGSGGFSNVTLGSGLNFTGGTLNVIAVNMTDFSISESGGKIVFKYGSTVVASIDSAGNFVSATNVTAYGTP